MDSTGKVKARWTRSFFTDLSKNIDQARYNCDICHKEFASASNLSLHNQVHVIERKYRCEPCQVSFHSLGHLQKHNRSSAHETRLQMTQSFGLPTSDNPRPYGCPECDTAFRKHGHLAKHLRSKSHITRLESRGIIPSGTYAALEKSGQDLKDKLVTTNYEQSLASMREVAMILFQNQMIFGEQLQSPQYPQQPIQQQQQQQQQPLQSPPQPPLYGSHTLDHSSGSSGNIGIIDSPTDMMMMTHFASSSAQQLPILSPGLFSSSSLSTPPPPPPTQQQHQSPPLAMPTNVSAGPPAASLMPHHSHQLHHNQSINPIHDQAIFQNLQHHHHPLPTGQIVNPNDLPGSQMLVAGHPHSHYQDMLLAHHESAHSLDYTTQRRQY